MKKRVVGRVEFSTWMELEGKNRGVVVWVYLRGIDRIRDWIETGRSRNGLEIYSDLSSSLSPERDLMNSRLCIQDLEFSTVRGGTEEEAERTRCRHPQQV